MEDYTVGSIGDLISGSNTPNKPKVVVSKVKKTPKKTPKKTEVEPTPEPHRNGEDIRKSPSKSQEDRPSAKVKKIKKKNKSIDVQENQEANIPKKQKKKRRATSAAEGGDVNVAVKKRKGNLEESLGYLSSSNENDTMTTVKSENDENAERRVKKKEKIDRKKLTENPEEMSRTVFVGNLPITLKKDKFKKLFMKYGNVDSVRIRGVPVADPKITKKVAMIKGEFHPDRKSFFGYVRFETHEEAIKSLEANGTIYKDHHLRVHLCNSKDQPDESKAIFVGNLSFTAEEEELYQLFEACGEIDYVRIVRDPRTTLGKGFGYVNFKTSDAVQLALEMQNVTLNDRELRISLCNNSAAKKNKKKNKNKMQKITSPGKIKSPKKIKKENFKQEEGDEMEKQSVNDKSFQGTQFQGKKKKNKINKGDLQKKKMIKKLTVNPK